MPVVEAVSVSPTSAVPVMVGAPVAAVFGGERRRRRAGACLLAAQDVDEAHLDLDLLAPLVGGQGVGGVGRVGDVLLVRRAVGVHPHPLVGEHVVQDVVIHDGVVTAVSSSPTWTVPEMTGSPVAGWFGGRLSRSVRSMPGSQMEPTSTYSQKTSVTASAVIALLKS